MTYARHNHHRIGRRMVLALPTAVVVAALIGPPSQAATRTPTSATIAPTTAAPAPTAQGIIMRDGGICDPIRWGC